MINQGLRVLKSPTECSYLRLAFSDLFWSIYEEYETQSTEEFTCYRGATLTEAEEEKLVRYEGEFIQLEGFISTSKRESIASTFKQNAFFIIRVPERKQRIRELDFGFAEISKHSHYMGEE